MNIVSHGLVGLISKDPFFFAGSVLPDLLNPELAFHYDKDKAPVWYKITHSLAFSVPLYFINPMLGAGYTSHLLMDAVTHDKEYRGYLAYPFGKILPNAKIKEWSDYKSSTQWMVNGGLLAAAIARWYI